jgi:hypothetical protein
VFIVLIYDDDLKWFAAFKFGDATRIECGVSYHQDGLFCKADVA